MSVFKDVDGAKKIISSMCAVHGHTYAIVRLERKEYRFCSRCGELTQFLQVTEGQEKNE